MIVTGFHSGDKIIQRAVATLCCNTSLFLDKRHNDEIIQIASALVHVISSNSSAGDVDTGMQIQFCLLLLVLLLCLLFVSAAICA